MARAIDVAPSSITRWEDPSGVIPRRRDLHALLEYYEVSEGETDLYLELRERARESGWWQRYGIKGDYGTYIGLEGDARKIERYDAIHIPGLFQTEDYQRALAAGSMADLGQEEIDRRIGVRKERQRVWMSARPQTWVIVDEAAVHRRVGGAAVMRAQLEHVIGLMAEPHVTVQLLPYEVGAHAAKWRRGRSPSSMSVPSVSYTWNNTRVFSSGMILMKWRSIYAYWISYAWKPMGTRGPRLVCVAR